MVPLHYLSSDSGSGCRIGGNCPVGLEFQFASRWTQYFGTFPLLERQGKEFSIFHRFDPRGYDPSRDLISFNNQILLAGELIWAVVHEASVRANESPNTFEARGMTMAAEAPDKVLADDGSLIPYSDSKLGGNCFIFRYQIRDAVAQLEAVGFQHLLQIGEAPGGALIEGFPWDPGFLNVWAADLEDPKTYRFCVQQ